MLTDNITFLGLLISAIGISILMFYLLHIKNKTQLHKVFILNCFLAIIWLLSLIAQITLSLPLNIEPAKFANVVYIGACFLPVSLLLTAIIYTNTKVKLSYKHLLLFIIPIISLLVLWTNNYHNLFYITYSTNISEAVFGKYFIVHSIYSYLCIGVSLFLLVSYAIKNRGFFSGQSLLLLIATLIPTIVNFLGTYNIVSMSIYVTPIAYIITLFCYAYAMFNFQLFKSSPIALQHVVDRISDSYLVLNDSNKIIDFNDTFIKTFNVDPTVIRNLDIFKLQETYNQFELNKEVLAKNIDEVYKTDQIIKYDVVFHKINKYFLIEISSIFNKTSFLGTVILFKDTTQHMQDIQTIRNNQNMLMEKERLASLGQLIGGISHNLKTPIMSISGAAEGLTDLINEYDASIGDPDVTEEDHHAIANDMRGWIDKIHSYTEYMSDIISAVKGQAVALSENENDIFTIDELLKRVNILMKHEIRNASLTLETKVDVPPSTTLHGDVNSLVQVVNNLITNAIQSYNGKKNESIILQAKKNDSNIVISVADHGCGMPKDVQEKLFKSMITTKGKNGTGLGMFMSYSTIKGHFNGDITFETELGKGTTFNIILPLSDK